MRALEAISETARTLGAGRGFWDAFSGSSIVSQAAGNIGMSVLATDTQRAAGAFAHALLPVGADATQVDDLPTRLDEVLDAPHPDEAAWSAYLKQEQEALEGRDYERLLALYAKLPQRWSAHAGSWNARTPMTTTFAGTYLSLEQSMLLDSARIRLQELRSDGNLGRWTENAILTALSHAASRAVHSAGKHFAQPLQAAVPGADNYPFIRSRALDDRSVSIPGLARTAASKIASRFVGKAFHEARTIDALSVTAGTLRERDTAVVYADPPYTAQQYSRFYHVLDTLISGQSAPLQTVRGKTLRGLYPEGRYSSPFCSRVQAPAAFERLTDTAHAGGASLMLSYSTSGQRSGNQRTVTESELIRIVSERYGAARVSVIPLEYGYRQFNAVNRRGDRDTAEEVLIVGEHA
ncbi:hypothetical protein [Microbacterium sp. NPDC089188]|uniref:hypothetical protein n=1 Tax=Microbacterium sp. NPDC089188 TaxID=3154971 RepID=UPI003414E6D3